MAKTALSTLAALWLALTLAFVALRVLPGDAITAQMTEAGLSATAIDERRAALGLDDPMLMQYTRYLGGVLRGDFGISLYTGEYVTDVIAARAGSTVTLAGAGSVVMAVLAVGLAVVASRYDVVGHIGRALIVASVGLPGYVTGTLVILIFGLYDPDSAAGVWLAAAVLGFHTGGTVAQALAVSLQETRDRAYITAAHARGLGPPRIALRHVLPNAVLPVLPLAAVQVGFLLSGTVITEIVFARPGLGRLMLDAVLRRDTPVVQGLIVLSAAVYALCVLGAQAASRLIDPRPIG